MPFQTPQSPDRNRTRPDPKCRRHRLDIIREVKGGLLMCIGACLESVREATGEGGEYRLGVTLAELGTRLIAKRLENHDRQMWVRLPLSPSRYATALSVAWRIVCFGGFSVRPGGNSSHAAKEKRHDPFLLAPSHRFAAGQTMARSTQRRLVFERSRRLWRRNTPRVESMSVMSSSTAQSLGTKSSVASRTQLAGKNA